MRLMTKFLKKKNSHTKTLRLTLPFSPRASANDLILVSRSLFAHTLLLSFVSYFSLLAVGLLFRDPNYHNIYRNFLIFFQNGLGSHTDRYSDRLLINALTISASSSPACIIGRIENFTHDPRE